MMIQPERIKPLNRRPLGNGHLVVYWMQASQRTRWNHALEYSIQQANELGRPLVVYFGLTDDYPEANERHYRFMVQGLAETRRLLRERGIGLWLTGATLASRCTGGDMQRITSSAR